MMEKEKMFVNEANCSNYWENSVLGHESDPFESAMSSMVSSPTASINGSENNIVVRELIGRLGSICNTSCYTTPLNSPPKLNLSIMENTNFPSLASLTDPGFAERAATFPCFAAHNTSFNIEMPPKLDGAAKNDSRENSSLSEQIPIDPNSRKRKPIPKGKQPSAPTPAKHPNNIASEKSESSAKRSKSEDEKDAANQKQSKDNNNNTSKSPEAPKDYIHVRARRGQATDAHSLAERVRREKISERMKVLQDLVPGCNKVTGKTVMLDEIINYVQSLQRQVEFLSMKLATVNPRMDFNMEALISSNSKDTFQSRGSLPHNIIYPSDSYHFLSQPNTHTAIPSGTKANNFFSPSLGRNQSMQQLPPIDNFSDSSSQVSTFWEDDLHSLVVQMGFRPNPDTRFSWDRDPPHSSNES